MFRRRTHLAFAGGTACSEVTVILFGRATRDLAAVNCDGCRRSVVFDYCRLGATSIDVRR